MIFASLFSGFGLADIGAKMAGCELAWGVELDPLISDVSRQLNHHVYNQSVIDTDFSKLERPDILWASPPCPNFSVAKTNAQETELDKALAKSVVDAIKILQPKYFILENVEGYKRSQSLKFIEGALFALGYWVDRQILNAADFGVPQTRKRLILRAVHGGFVPSLPLPKRWIGWHEAIQDLIPNLPESEFAPWQLERLPESMMTSCITDAFLLNSNQSEREDYFRVSNKPSYAVRCASGGRTRAFLVDGMMNSNGKTVTIVDRHSPSFTVKASAAKQLSRAWLNQGKVVAMTPRALARFQSMPDWYELPEKKTLACKGIGNGVPCLLAKSVIESLIA